MAQRYRKRATVEAWQWLGQPRGDWPAWMERGVPMADGTLAVGGFRDPVRKGEWLVREDGRLMRLTAAIFDATYEAVSE